MLCRELGIFRQKVVRGAFEGSRLKELDPRDRSYDSILDRDRSYDSILDPRPEPLYKPTQSIQDRYGTRSLYTKLKCPQLIKPH